MMVITRMMITVVMMVIVLRLPGFVPRLPLRKVEPRRRFSRVSAEFSDGILPCARPDVLKVLPKGVHVPPVEVPAVVHQLPRPLIVAVCEGGVEGIHQGTEILLLPRPPSSSTTVLLPLLLLHPLALLPHHHLSRRCEQCRHILLVVFLCLVVGCVIAAPVVTFAAASISVAFRRPSIAPASEASLLPLPLPGILLPLLPLLPFPVRCRRR